MLASVEMITFFTQRGRPRVRWGWRSKRNANNPRTLCKVRGSRPVQRCAARRTVFMNEFMSLSKRVAHDRPKPVRNAETTFLFQFKDRMKSTRRKRFTLSLYLKLLRVGRAPFSRHGTSSSTYHVPRLECEMSGSLKVYFHIRRLSEV